MKKAIYGSMVFLPSLVSAQTTLTIVPFLQRVSNVLINPVILLVFALSTAYFVYGIVKFLATDPGDASTRKEARNAIIWGIVGMVVMFSVYGLIRFVLDTFGISEPTYLERKL